MKSKFMNWLWAPLSLAIFGTYAIQRGLGAFAKSGLLTSDFGFALQIYFVTMSVGMLFMGLFLDNVNTRKAILVGTGLGIGGMLLAPYTPWGFGLLFGAAAVIMKLSPFASPLKLLDGNDGFRIAPQASAKNFGGAFFMLFLGAALISWGFPTASILMALLFCVAGIVAYFILPDDKIEGWKWSIFKELSIDWKFWAMMLYFFVMCGMYWLVITGLFPALSTLGLTKTSVITWMASSFIVTGAARFPVAWAGDKYGHWIFMIIGTLGMVLCYFLLPISPMLSLWLFVPFSSMHTANYWPQCKQLWGAKYINTVLALGFVFQYFGAGIFYGKWF